MSLNIFNIQKFSLHDGPGIRTVVFFQGCPLSCKWCANPESQSFDSTHLWDKDKCIHCGACASNCPNEAIAIINREVHINASRCTRCKRCEEGCPSKALSLVGQKRSVEDVLNVCMQDFPFYQESGGGVTLSGGEPLMQPDDAMILLDALKAQGVHTAIETAGYVEPEIFTRVCSKADLLLFDIKHWDTAQHMVGTGVDNQIILVNLHRTLAMGKDFLVRIPVIPGYNDASSDAEAFSKFLRKFDLNRVQLLPFHQLGEKKYEMLNMPYAYTDVRSLEPKDLDNYINILRLNGLEAFI